MRSAPFRSLTSFTMSRAKVIASANLPGATERPARNIPP
jgi:hypothetical protein